VDETIILLPLNLVSIKRIKILIYIFEILSGLSTNFDKSSLYQLGPPTMVMSQVSTLLHYKTGSFPFTYLGLSLKSTILYKADWQPLLDRIDKRLTAWKGHMLSLEGRSILVNSVLTYLPLYFMSFFF